MTDRILSTGAVAAGSERRRPWRRSERTDRDILRRPGEPRDAVVSSEAHRVALGLATLYR